MHRRALACSTFLFVTGRSDGNEPFTGTSGVVGAQLEGVRSAMLSGSAEAQEVFIETEAEDGRVTIDVSNEEAIDGTFIFQGTLVQGSDTVGGVSARGSFRAKVFP